MSTLWLLLQNAFWAGVAALGFAILFNVPLRTLPGCALGGAMAYLIRTALTVQTGLVGVETATLAGATTVGFLGVIFGRLWHVPAVVFVVPGVMPLMPGSQAFSTMVDIVILATGDMTVITETLLVEAAINAIKTMLILCAIAGGIAIPSLLLRRHQPMT